MRISLSGGRRFSKLQIISFVFVFVAVAVFIIVRIFASKQPIKVGDPAKNPKNRQFISNQVLVKLKPSAVNKLKSKAAVKGSTQVDINSANVKTKASKFEPLISAGVNSNPNAEVFRWYKVTIKSPAPAKIVTASDKEAIPLLQAVNEYKHIPDVESAQPNYIVRTTALPNDPFFTSSGSWGQSYDDLWSLKKINMPQAWDKTTGANSVLVADIDTGLDRNNPDLTNNVWSNPGEKGPTTFQGPAPNCISRGLPLDKSCNNLDDDGNTYPDDVYGWNFADHNNDTMDRFGHGTHVAGTIGAIGNNGQGVVGVNWNTKILPIKALNDSGFTTTSSGAEALVYAADMGAKVSNNSWGGTMGPSPNVFTDAVDYEYSKGMVTVTAAGNDAVETRFDSPTNSVHAITVSASGVNDQIACFSNWGEKIDVAAPGGDAAGCGGVDNAVLSTRSAVSDPYFKAVDPAGNYAPAKGTSMAAPHVAGLAALLLAKYPTASPDQIRQIIRTSATDLGANGSDNKYGYGRIDAAKALNTDPASVITPSITSPATESILPGSASNITGTAAGNGFARYDVEIARFNDGNNKDYGTVGNWTLLGGSTTPVTNGKLATINSTQFSDGIYDIRLTVTNTAGKIFRAESYYVQIKNFQAKIVSPIYNISQGKNDINGIARVIGGGLSLANYKLEWGTGQVPTSWSTAGITITSPTTAIGPLDETNSVGGNLASWDTSSLNDGQMYSLRLTVTASNGASTQYLSHYRVDKDILAGWPKAQCTQTNPFDQNCMYGRAGGAAMADIDGDGKKEIITFGGQRFIFAYHQDGSVVSGFPYKLPANEDFGTSLNAIITSDINNDGKVDIIVSARRYITQYGAQYYNGDHLYIIGGNGQLITGWIPPTFYAASGLWPNQTPAVADMNGDGKKEIVIIDRPAIANDLNNGPFSTTSRIHAYEPNGSELAGFPTTFTHNAPPGAPDCSSGICISQFPDDYYPPPVIADLNTDGKNEVLWGIGNQFFVFDNTGHTLSGWPYTAPNDENNKKQIFGKKPSVGDIDGDGKLEVIALSGEESENSYIAKLYALKFNGTLMSGWPKNGIFAHSPGSLDGPTVADLDHDGKDDVLSNIWINPYKADPNTPEYVSDKIFFGNGASDITFQSNILKNNVAHDLSTSPIVFDLNGDGQPAFTAQDVVPSWKESNGTVHSRGISITNKNGDNLWSKYWPVITYDNFDTPQFTAYAPLVSSLTNNTQQHMLTNVDIGNYNDLQSYSNNSLFIWKLPNSTAVPHFSWPNYGYDTKLQSYINLRSQQPNPTVSFTQPQNNATVTGTANLAGSFTAGSANPTITVTSQSNNAIVCTAIVTGSNWNCSWDTTKAPNGTYDLKATITVNGQSASATKTLVVNNLTNKPGDVNRDNGVNALDLSIILTNWNKTGQSRAQGDLSGDSMVNALDLSQVLTNWGK